MKDQQYFRLLTIIATILVFSLIIGDVIMAPIIMYHDLLVEFFGWLFLILIILLTLSKFIANFKVIKYSKKLTTYSSVFKKTFTTTFLQIFQKTRGVVMYLVFIIIVGFLTFFTIWLNSKIVTININ
ncbi:MAG: hypothetical protein OEV78_01055 [Spirochaetia bacterium]|nr:hypothetical protein [Spirochaetia bacterium]